MVAPTRNWPLISAGVVAELGSAVEDPHKLKIMPVFSYQNDEITV